MKRFKCYVCFLLTVLLCCGICGCGKEQVQEPVHQESKQIRIKIPDVESLDINTAKTLLAGKGLIPKVEYEYNNDYDYDMVIRTEPPIGMNVEEDYPITVYVSKGPSYYELPDTVGWMRNINGIDNFIWPREDPEGIGTKVFYRLRMEEGYLYIPMSLNCKSQYDIEFYGDFGTASINDTFDKTVPIKVIYDNKIVNNQGEKTNFEVKIPLSDLGVQKPTNIYIEFDFLVDGNRETFKAGFDLTW